MSLEWKKLGDSWIALNEIFWNGEISHLTLGSVSAEECENITDIGYCYFIRGAVNASLWGGIAADATTGKSKAGLWLYDLCEQGIVSVEKQA